MFIELKGEWWNIDQIAKIEKYHPAKSTGWGDPIAETTDIIYVATLSSGQTRGVTEEEFRRIMNISSC